MPREREEDELVAKPISFGINAPHCCTSHADCKLTSQRSTITRMIQRVKSGRRKIYERARAAENWGRLGGMVPTFEAGWIRAARFSNEVCKGRRGVCALIKLWKGRMLALLSQDYLTAIGLEVE
jgi:hypothetical protein